MSHPVELTGSIPKKLCKIIDGINTNGSTDICDSVACADGTYNELGYATNDTPCMPCAAAFRTVTGAADDIVMYLESTSCGIVATLSRG